eukprot:scaffold113216_cov19-Tisochrysis_lutea.AAC.3
MSLGVSEHIHMLFELSHTEGNFQLQPSAQACCVPQPLPKTAIHTCAQACRTDVCMCTHRRNVWPMQACAQRVTRERLESFDRPVRGEPQWFDGKKDALIRDFRNYLGILKSVHSGADLQAAASAAGNQCVLSGFALLYCPAFLIGCVSWLQALSSCCVCYRQWAVLAQWPPSCCICWMQHACTQALESAAGKECVCGLHVSVIASGLSFSSGQMHEDGKENKLPCPQPISLLGLRWAGAGKTRDTLLC